MLKWFEYAGAKHLVSECVKVGGPLVNFFPLAYLRALAEEREWTGKPSCTQLLNGTRLAYLNILCDYADDPSGAVFKMIGMFGHSFIELEDDDLKCEMKVEVAGITGKLDCLELLADGTWGLTDHKTSGSYKVAMFLKGEEVEDWHYQSNFYRIGAERAGYHVTQMRIFNAVRDGKTSIARQRGIPDATYYIDVDFIDDEKITAYFGMKRDALLNHLDGFYISQKTVANMEDPEVRLGEVYKNAPTSCLGAECWNGRRCKGYCGVSEHCKAIGGNEFASSSRTKAPKKTKTPKPKGVSTTGKKDPELEGF